MDDSWRMSYELPSKLEIRFQRSMTYNLSRWYRVLTDGMGLRTGRKKINPLVYKFSFVFARARLTRIGFKETQP